MVFALLTGFAIIALAVVMWVYFDAMERGKAAIGWALSIVLLGWLWAAPLVLYVIFRDTGQKPVVPPGGARRQALYVVSFSGLATLLTGLSLLVTVTIMRAISDDAISKNDYGDALAGAIAAVIVGFIAWAPTWFQAEPRLEKLTDDQEFRATFYLHRAYLYTVIGAGLIVAFLTGLWLLGGGLSDVFGSEDIAQEDWLPALGPLSIALLTVGYHYSGALETTRYRTLLARFDAIPPPSSPAPAEVAPAASAGSAAQPSVGAARFCTRCGARGAAGDAFCFACGAAVAGA